MTSGWSAADSNEPSRIDRECREAKLRAGGAAAPGRTAIMTIRVAGAFAVVAGFACIGPASAQDLGPQVKKFADGVYAFVGENYNSNAGIVLTQDGVVLIDSGHNPIDSRKILEVASV
jgi:hypothetical protein